MHTAASIMLLVVQRMVCQLISQLFALLDHDRPRSPHLSHVVGNVQVEVDAHDELDQVLHQVKLLVDYSQV